MSKFCRQCGAQLDDSAMKCETCGYEFSAPAANTQEGAKKALPFNLNTKTLAAIGAGVVAFIIVLVLILGGGGGYRGALDNYVGLITNADKNKLEKLAPKEYWDYMEDQSGIDKDDMIDMMLVSMEASAEYMEEEYGDNLRVSYKVLEEEALDKDDLNDIKDSVKSKYDIAKKSVTAGYEVEVELTIKGSEDEDADEAKMYVVQIDGQWYICSKSGSLGTDAMDMD